ncbi:MAG: GHMP kinase, partial [Phycisphaerae bacterium]
MILCKTPLRVSFLGGGTDFPAYFRKHGGAVLGSAVDHNLYHSVMPFHSRLFDYSIRIAYREVERVRHVQDIQHAPFREAIQSVGFERDIEISLTSDLPSFSGLGSSSSFIVGLLNALYAFKGVSIPKLDLAHKAIDIEQNILKEAVGCQDQVFAAVGGFNLIEFTETENIVVNRIPMSANRMKTLEDRLLFYYTGIARRAADLEAKKMENLAGITKHLTQMRQLVDEGYRAITNGNDFDHFGTLLDKAWALKKELTRGVSCTTIDDMYDAAMEAGALGGKLLGAGGGGFLLFYVPEERQARVRQALS